jgi:N-acetylmuramoyl-L-alanine amidase
MTGSLILRLAVLAAAPPPAPPPAPPDDVVIATPRGRTSIPVSLERGMAVAVPRLAGPLGLAVTIRGAEATVGLGGVSFVFQLGAPFVRSGETVLPLVGEPYLARDTLFLPLHWLVESLPRLLGTRYRWHAAARRLEELPAAGAAVPAVATPAAGAAHPITGLRRRHVVMIDPGHGGLDPGNPGLHFPPGIVEKHITLAIGRLLRAELDRRGLTARLTRSRDTLVDLADRGAMCREDCDLFVSIHVNAMPAGPRRARARGIETYFLSDARTEDQKRVAKMENDAVRFEAHATDLDGEVGFILRDLQQNEYLRESARLAELVQGSTATAHPGDDRGVQQAAFTVLSRARRPAILIEVGFATNRDDAAFIAAALGQRKIANAIADGIVAYLLEFERRLAAGAPGGAP